MQRTIGPATLFSIPVAFQAAVSRQARTSWRRDPQLVQITGRAMEALLQSREWWPNLPHR
jgi:hypothetical protein